MKVGKPKSKRTPVRLRHKIEKASAAKQRKNRKEAKKNPQWRSRVKKDPGIPNLFPYKAKMLAEIEEKKREKEEEQQRRREIAKAQREGRAVGEIDTSTAGVVADDEGDDILLDEEDDDSVDEDEEMEEDGGSANPMAALLASARARADAYAPEDEGDDESEDESDGEEWAGITDTPKSKTNGNKSVEPAEPTAKSLPKLALEDPIKVCTKLLQQMQQTQDGIQRLIDHYQMPPLVTAGSDLPTRFLVEVARKRGRLGKGGVPNLHSAALTVLSDLNEGRLVLPAVETVAVEQKQLKGKKNGAVKGQVTVVEKMAEPFRIEGLWGGDGKVDDGEMVVEP